MNNFENKNIVLGITGGIAVYKAADLVSKLRKLKANVDVIMTKSAEEFVTRLTFQTLSGNLVAVDTFEAPKAWSVEHISLAQKADLFLIVPATANIIGKMANGIADDMLSTTVIATKAPVLIAPAMNTGMYENPIVQSNIQKLETFGYNFVGPGEGFLACGDIGAGRLIEIDTIIERAESLLTEKKDFQGKKILVTAGPTRESLDPVRFLTNHSSGKMGYAIARAAKNRGGQVVLITGNTNIKKPEGVEIVNVDSALEMHGAVMDRFEESDIIIQSAAVADYRPKNISDQKIKKSSDMSIELVRNPDIAYEIGLKKTNQCLVGFAAETENLIENAKKKLEKKKFDLIVANDLTEKGAGFLKDTNVATLISANGDLEKLPKQNKSELADYILDKIAKL